MRRLLSVSIELHPQIHWLGWLLYTEGFQGLEDTLYYLPSRRPRLSLAVPVVPNSGLFIAVTSGKLSRIQAQSCKQTIWDLFIGLLHPTHRTPVTVWHRHAVVAQSFIRHFQLVHSLQNRDSRGCAVQYSPFRRRSNFCFTNAVSRSSWVIYSAQFRPNSSHLVR